MVFLEVSQINSLHLLKSFCLTHTHYLPFGLDIGFCLISDIPSLSSSRRLGCYELLKGLKLKSGVIFLRSFIYLNLAHVISRWHARAFCEDWKIDVALAACLGQVF